MKNLEDFFASSCHLSDNKAQVSLNSSLPPEVEEGNIEYKLKLVDPSPSRFEHLVTQMKWRLQEGEGEAIYEIGVEDSGILAGLPKLELEASLNTLRKMAKKLGATITILRERAVDTDSRKALQILVRKVPDDQQVVNYKEARTVEEICENSTKLITLIDLAGHQKYLKTTIFGLTGYCPDCAMLVVSANTGMAGTTKEHLGFARALDVPVFVVVSKIDMCPESLIEKTIQQLEKILKSPSCNKVPFRVSSEDDAITAATNFDSQSIIPIFSVSSVTGKHLDLLTTFLNVVPPLRNLKEREKCVQDITEFQVDELFTVPGVGTVVGGNLKRGSIREGDSLMLGPMSDGEFHHVTVKTVHRNRLPCRLIQAGQSATVALYNIERESLRKGMVLVSPESSPFACIEFDANIYVLFHAKHISTGFQTTIHVGNVRQTVKIVRMDKEAIKTNEKAQVTFHLIKQPEYIRIGAQLLFREGQTKGMGEIE
ncbi:GTP-binding protein 2-like [Octopus vulgaris]|uniref:GTP-binding protein 2-like n=1 Tax=Octopus vulgaris TaxID=6645 RepID=A0AA36FCP7_OCTVU|nr:GTP-binding protein 2-like [Octopus vulgaris]